MRPQGRAAEPARQTDAAAARTAPDRNTHFGKNIDLWDADANEKVKGAAPKSRNHNPAAAAAYNPAAASPAAPLPASAASS